MKKRKIVRDLSQSNFIKLQLMKYFRFDRDYIFVCSECINNSDISAINSKVLAEVEVKISVQDFLHEFDGSSRIKSYKHSVYQGVKQPRKNFICPNFYYFCVTPDILTYVTKYVKEHNLPYGVLVCREKRVFGRRSHIECIKQAKKLHPNTPCDRAFLKISKRVQSEMITLKQKSLDFGK